jgi:hypothetical protein
LLLGVVRLGQALDYESNQILHSMVVQAIKSDNVGGIVDRRTVSTTVNIVVQDFNDNAPQFTRVTDDDDDDDDEDDDDDDDNDDDDDDDVTATTMMRRWQGRRQRDDNDDDDDDDDDDDLLSSAGMHSMNVKR